MTSSLESLEGETFEVVDSSLFGIVLESSEGKMVEINPTTKPCERDIYSEEQILKLRTLKEGEQ